MGNHIASAKYADYRRDGESSRLTDQALEYVARRPAIVDAGVAAAYGWPADLAEEEILARLLALNLERGERG